MANGSERSVIFAAAAHLLREAARVSLAFTCVSVAYLVSGIPYSSLADSSDPFPVRAHTSAQAASSVVPLPRPAGRVAADSFWSQALGIRKQFVVYLPPSYETNTARRYPVAYYLHGMWGDEWNWVRSGGIDRTLDSLTARGLPEMIVVMPDGDDGWYTTWNNLGNNADCRRGKPPDRQTESVDAYCVPWPKYDDYIARDLVARVDSSYRTIQSRDGRAIAGLSMGGYGAISLALAYPDVFSAADLMSSATQAAPSLLGSSPLARAALASWPPLAVLALRPSRTACTARSQARRMWSWSPMKAPSASS